MQTMHGKIGRISLYRYSTPFQGLLPQSYRRRKPSRQKRDRYASIETESISQTSRESTEASRQHFEDPPNNQDQDIVQAQDIVQDQDIMQEQTQERIQPENEINICKF